MTSARFATTDKWVFLNHAAVAPISPAAADALRAYADHAETRSYVQSGWYRGVHEVREQSARLLNARGAHEIAFIPNTSTGLATIAEGLSFQPGDQVIITDVEYPANRYPWENLKRKGVELIEVAQLPDGRIDVEDILHAMTDKTRLVSVSMVQYASGFRLDVKPIADLVHRVGGYLCIDGIQALGLMPVDVQAMGIDFLAADGHKWLLGPEGAGLLYVHEDLAPLLRPPVVGWLSMVDPDNYGDYRFEFHPDARRFEPGTWNIPGILALGASVDLLMAQGIESIWSQVDTLTQQFCQGAQDKGYRIFSPRGEGERSGIVTFDPKPGNDARRVASELQQQGVILAVREGRLRISPHFYNTESQIERAVDLLP